MDRIKFILLCLAGWMNREQQAVIDYQREEIGVLMEILGKRPRFNDDQRRRLAAKAKKIRYGKLKEIANIATPQTLVLVKNCIAVRISTLFFSNHFFSPTPL